MATTARILLAAVVAMLLVVVGPCHAARPAPPEQQTAKQPSSTTVKAGNAVVDGTGGITAIYNFGDSLSDTGNLLREGATGMLQHTTGLPYGSAIGGATGRCSDGYLMIDYLAKDLGLPLLNPYLAAAEGADFSHGVNFAVAGATALDAAALARRGVAVAHTNSSLAVQLQRFKDHMSATTAGSPEEIREKLARSLVMVGEIGGNDYNYAFSANRPAGGERSIYDLGRMAAGVAEAMALVPDVVRAVTSAAREVLDMGATTVVVPGNLPLGCAPSYLAAVNETDPAAFDGTGCLAALNLFAQAHNVLLQQGVRELRRAYPSATVSYADYFYAYVRMLRDAGAGELAGFAAEGAAARTQACCGAGGGAYNFDMDRMCGAPGASVCARPDQRISWDGVHMTQRANRVMADLLYHKGFASPPPVEFPRT